MAWRSNWGTLEGSVFSSDSENDEDYIPSGGYDEGESLGRRGEDDESVVQQRRRRGRALPLSDAEGEDDGENASTVTRNDGSSYGGSAIAVNGDFGTYTDSDESLPSIGEGDEVGLQRNSEQSQSPIQNNDIPNNGGAGAASGEEEESLPSVGGAEEEEEERQVQTGPVRGFRVHVNADGEEIFEFASDNENFEEEDNDEDEGANDPAWNEILGVEPAVEFMIPGSVINSIAVRVNQRRASRVARHRLRVDAAADEPMASTSTVPIPRGRSSNANRRKPQRKGRSRRKGRKPQKKAPKGESETPSKPKAPLKPLVIYEDWNGDDFDDHYNDYFKRISKTTQHKVHINIRELSHESEIKPPVLPEVVNVENDGHNAVNDLKSEMDTFATPPPLESVQDVGTPPFEGGFVIGQVQFDRCGRQPWLWENKSILLESKPHILELTLHVSKDPSSSILHMQTRRTLSKEEVEERPGPAPKLSKANSERELEYVVTEHYFYHVDPVGAPVDLFTNRGGLGSRKVFMIDFNRFDVEKQCFIFDIVLLESFVMGDHSIHELPVLKQACMKDVFANFLSITPPTPPLQTDTHKKEDIEWFYGQIRKYHKQEELPPSDIPLQPASLKPTLRNYQRDAVHWMLYREGCLDHCIAHSSNMHLNRVNLIEAFLDKMYIPVTLTRHVSRYTTDVLETKTAYYNPYNAYLCWNKPKIPSLPSGGILCDEMGLGKTVETLCLILLNEKPISDVLRDYFNESKDKDVEKVMDEEEQEDDPSFSWEDIPSDSPSDSEDSSFSGRKRKKKRGSTRRKKAKMAPNILHKRGVRTRKRAMSPCEFIACAQPEPEEKEVENTNQNEEDESIDKSLQPNSLPLKTVTVIDALEQKIKSSTRRGGGKRKKTEVKEIKEKKRSNYDNLKVLYDNALSDYKYAEMARCMPKFHGRFYDVNIEMKQCFECICGSEKYDYPGAEIVQCNVCASSQHAECVGFDNALKSFFQKINRPYLCPHCEALEPPFETKSTLIITPPSISHQWIKEIQRHVQNHRLNILFYKGVSYHGYIPPAQLGRYDLVITTYSVLSAELNYVDLPHCNSVNGRRFRNAKRFLSIPSPLPSVLWWRVCLDEAQMVEGIGTKMSMMAMRLQAIHRWCVTGTPMNKGLQDLFGLFVFMNVFPISYDIWWNALVRDPFLNRQTSLLYEVFGQLIWRNGKQDVLDQLGIPDQTEVIHWLNFSPVETHFYKQQFQICSNRILDKINRLRSATQDIDILSARLTSLDRFSLHGLLTPFLELRQACCHPQIVKGQLISLQKGTLTMEELLDRLVKKTQLQCHEDHRLIVASLNGLAGLYIISENWTEAAEKYRQVLQSAEKHKDHFSTDSLQLLHTMENLAEILDGNHSGVPFTLRDSSLRDDSEVVRKKYMKKYADAVKAAQDSVTPLTSTVEEIRHQFTMHSQSWWVATLEKAERIQKVDSLIHSLKLDLVDVTKKNIKTTVNLGSKFSDRHGLQQVMTENIIGMEDLREEVLEGLQELQTTEPSVFVDAAIRCHLRQSDLGEGDVQCKLCIYHEQFLLYESILFKTEKKDKITRTGRNYQQRKQLGDLADELTEKTKDELLVQETEDLKATTEHVQLINEELRRGTWGDSETEVILKGILRFARINRLSSDITENGGVHVKILEAMKKEFRFMRILWRQIFDQVSALDELSQATTRLVVVDGDPQWQQEPQPSSSRNLKQLKSGIVEKTLKIQNIHVIGRHEIEPKMTQLQTEHATGHESLAIHLGQLLYLNNLKKNGYGRKGTVNTEDCPICSTPLGKEWSVLRCGHSYCSDCVKKMCPGALQTFLCPLCRHSMKFADVSFVDTSDNHEFSAENVAGPSHGERQKQKRDVKGSHSTKVEAVVQTLLQLQDTHPGEKCILFSTWSDVLDIIAKALSQNDIKYSFLSKPGQAFHTNLQTFKEREDLQVLLMPLTSGAKGLNIIEATHVLLVEPILNLASELQAIGRVHRIGQTRPTFVHRFYVKRTIEDKLFNILKGQDVSSDEEGSLTVNDLRNLVSNVPK